MAKDFGSSEDCVNNEDIFFRGKKTAAHEYIHLENEFRYLYVLKVLKFQMFQVLKQ